MRNKANLQNLPQRINFDRMTFDEGKNALICKLIFMNSFGETKVTISLAMVKSSEAVIYYNRLKKVINCYQSSDD